MAFHHTSSLFVLLLVPYHVVCSCFLEDLSQSEQRTGREGARALLASPDVRALMILLLRMVIVRQRHRNPRTHDRVYESISSSGTGTLKELSFHVAETYAITENELQSPWLSISTIAM